jgi:serine/threonine protein kinase
VTDRAPARLGKYEIVKELGAGAMGVVYLAYDRAIDHQVAVKTIRKDLLDGATATNAIARFRQEAMAAGRLTHPGIVAVYDYGEDENVAYIVMEFAPGQDLARYAGGRSLDLPEIGHLMAQLLDALEYAHQAGVVHRDVKPSNILLADRLKITDFGIARVASSRLTQTGAVMGTPAYMAPEQYSGAEADHRVDLFASGVLLYELLTGQLPFPGESIEQIAYKVCHAEHLPATRVRPALPPTVDPLLARALAKDKRARFATARELSAAIAAGLSGKDFAPASSTAVGSFASAATVAAPAPWAAGSPPSRDASNVTPEAIERVTQTLAKYVGPIAKVMVKKVSAGAEARTYRDLCVSVSARLPAEDRPRFLRDVGVE